MTKPIRTGRLIVLEGIDGAGKSTQAALLVEALRRRGVRAVLFREPTGGVWGRRIRAKARRAGSLTPRQELALFLKDRRENVVQNIRPALARGEIVVLDRYYFSTIAYQGARGLDPARIRRLNEAFAPPPDLVFVLDVDPAGGLGRIRGRRARDEHFEREDYLKKVRAIFRRFRGRRFVRIDASAPAGAVRGRIWARVMRLLGRGRAGRQVKTDPRYGIL